MKNIVCGNLEFVHELNMLSVIKNSVRESPNGIWIRSNNIAKNFSYL